MKFLMMKLMLLNSMMAVTMKNPMSLSIILLTQTMMMILMMNTIFNSSWIPMITFLIMIGGLLIIFMYISSINSNEKFKLNFKMTLMLIFFMIGAEEMLNSYQIMEEQMIENNLSMSMSKLYNKTMMVTMMLIMYLIITMITVNKIIKMFYGPLRSTT
uniref:NADH dehydrogenase subunit 6 n=1 Tax=Hypsauchenia hardwickii TaxID=2605027 RepID=A0A5B9T363_9HEMI|nr:NADH dehydrogenase subunit 6 [Hypsauchenia hardwickii]QEG98436.1 NADH dehydrogenase subunit 6 [Hypsauchenia hardwickii]